MYTDRDHSPCYQPQTQTTCTQRETTAPVTNHRQRLHVHRQTTAPVTNHRQRLHVHRQTTAPVTSHRQELHVHRQRPQPLLPTTNRDYTDRDHSPCYQPQTGTTCTQTETTAPVTNHKQGLHVPRQRPQAVLPTTDRDYMYTDRDHSPCYQPQTGTTCTQTETTAPVTNHRHRLHVHRQRPQPLLPTTDRDYMYTERDHSPCYQPQTGTTCTQTETTTPVTNHRQGLHVHRQRPQPLLPTTDRDYMYTDRDHSPCYQPQTETTCTQRPQPLLPTTDRDYMYTDRDHSPCYQLHTGTTCTLTETTAPVTNYIQGLHVHRQRPQPLLPTTYRDYMYTDRDHSPCYQTQTETTCTQTETTAPVTNHSQGLHVHRQRPQPLLPTTYRDYMYTDRDHSPCYQPQTGTTCTQTETPAPVTNHTN